MVYLICILSILILTKVTKDFCYRYIDANDKYDMDIIFYNLAKMGYKLDKEKLDKLSEEDEVDYEKLEKLYKVLINIPIANIIFVRSQIEDSRRNFINACLSNGAAIPMNENEKKIAATLKDEELSEFLIVSSWCDENDEIVSFQNGSAKIRENNTLHIANEPLELLSYSLGEVQKLSDTLKGTYKLYNIQGRNFAFIGLDPKYAAKGFTRIRINDAKYKDFKEIEDPEDKKFIVYPYLYTKELEDTIKLIKENRHRGYKSSIGKIKEYKTKKITL